MLREQLRLELVKITHNPARGPEETLAAAKAYECWILESTDVAKAAGSPAKAETTKKSSKKVDNPDPLS